MTTLTLRLNKEEEQIFNSISGLYGGKQTLKILFNWIEKNLSNTDDPRSKGKALVGNKKGYWRYRIGDYRLITRIEDDRLIIIAINFKHRREVYN